MESGKNKAQFSIQQMGDRYTLSINGIFYDINAITYCILSCIKNGDSYEKIAQTIGEEFDITTTAEEVHQIIDKNISPLFLKEHSLNRNKTSAFWFKKEILTYSQYKNLIKPIKFLFTPTLFWVLILPLLIFNITVLFKLNNPAVEFQHCETSLLSSGLTYLSLFFIMIFHELGHAASSLKFGVKSKSIGFGFYSIFPVFFADVTAIWSLSKEKRMIVNLAGIFIQGILGVILFIAYYNSLELYPNSMATQTLYTIFVANSLTMLVNLFPFFKFDGYWCYSDFFNLSNLGRQSRNLLKYVAKTYLRLPIYLAEKERKQLKTRSIPLIIYTLAKSITNLLLLYLIYILITRIIRSASNFSIQNIDFSLCGISENIYNILIAYIFIRVIVKFTLRIVKTVKTYISI